MKIMVLTPYLPHSRVGHGGGSAVRDLVKHLACHHEVLLVAMVRPGERDLIGEVEDLGLKVAPLFFADTQATGMRRLGLFASRGAAFFRSVISGYPVYVEKYFSAESSLQIRQLVQQFKPDAIQIEYLQMSLYARNLSEFVAEKKTDPPCIVLNSHELGSVPRDRRAAAATSPLQKWWFRREAHSWRRLQTDACQWVNHMLCVTEEDRLLFESMGGSKLLTVPLGMDLENIKPLRAPSSPPVCLFVGSFNHRPNVLAANLLINQIWPQVIARRPEVRLVLAGRGSRQHLKGASGSKIGITATGFVEDLTPLFSQATLFVAPLPEGGGIKIKILEAMARAIPIITTPVGAEGITTVEDDTLLICDPVHGFAEAIIQSLDDPQAEARASRGRDLMERKFSWKAITARLAKIYKDQY